MNENEVIVEAEVHAPPEKSVRSTDLSTSSDRRGGRRGGRTTTQPSLRSGKSRTNEPNEFELDSADEFEGTIGVERGRAAGVVCGRFRGVPRTLGEPHRSGRLSNQRIPMSEAGSDDEVGDDGGAGDFEEPRTKKQRMNEDEDSNLMNSQRLLIDQLLKAQEPKGNSDRLKCVPEFHPEKNTFTTKQWIATLEQFSAANKWNEANLIYHMQSQLRGTAKIWFDGLENYNRTWNEWKLALDQNFPEDKNHAKRFRLMDSRKKKTEETYEEYFFEKMKLLRPCKLAPNMAVDFLIEGIINENVRLAAKMKGCTTPEELLQQVILQITNPEEAKTPSEELEPSSRFRQNSRNQNYQQPSRNEESSNSGDQGPEETRKSKCEKCGLNHSSNECRTPPSSSSTGKITCLFNCGKKGVRDCLEQKMECSNCGWLGHKNENCPRTK